MLEAALDIVKAGVEVIAVADSRSEGHDEDLVGALIEQKVNFLPGWVAVEATGQKVVSGARIAALSGSGSQMFACDLLVASAGLAPVAAPLYLAKAKMEFDDLTGFFLPQGLPSKVHAAGRILGLNDPQAVEVSGRLAGLKAAHDCGAEVAGRIKETQERLADLPSPQSGSHFVRAPGLGRRSFVCFDEDVTVKDLGLVVAEGFDSVELCKRYSTAGMGPSQGGISAFNLPLVLSEMKGQPPGSIPPANFRSPLTGTLMGTLAGRNYHLYKRTPLHDLQTQAGGRFRLAGAWKRVGQFSQHPYAHDEIENVRRNVGLIDVSTLGKFRLFGPDALKALQRMYVGDMAKLSPGKLKYTAMCNEDGCIIDDGVVGKLGEDDYYFTTSTGRAAATVEWFRFHTRYEDWKYYLVNLTDAFGAINLAGPNSRTVLQRITSADVSNAAFPYMGFREVTLVNDVKARLLRVGFLGEMGFEIHVPSSMSPALWELLMEAGREFGLKPFGLEAQNVLRLEKGHIIIGFDSELITTLIDVGLGFLWDRHKKGFKTVGAVALRQTEHQPGRRKLVGFKMDNPQETPADGAIVVDADVRGRVSASRYSPTLKESIGLALVEEPLAQLGTRLTIFQAGWGNKRLPATVVPTPFYDPSGQRLRM